MSVRIFTPTQPKKAHKKKSTKDSIRDQFSDQSVIKSINLKQERQLDQAKEIIQTNIYNLNFNENHDPKIFNKKNSIKHKTVRWVNKFGQTDQESFEVQDFQTKKTFLTEHFDMEAQETIEETKIHVEDPYTQIQPMQPSKHEVPTQEFSFEDIPLKEFMNIRREIHSAFSSIPWTFADREEHQFNNNHKNIPDSEILKNIPPSLKIRSVSHLQKNHRTGISRPGSRTNATSDMGHKYYGVEAENNLNESMHSQVVKTKEVQDLLNLPEPMLREAVQEAVSLGLMSVYEAKTLLEIINRPMSGLEGDQKDQITDLNLDMSRDSTITTATKLPLPASLPESQQTNYAGTYQATNSTKNSPRTDDSSRESSPRSQKSPRLHRVGLMDPNVGFQPIEKEGGIGESPLAISLGRNFNTPASVIGSPRIGENEIENLPPPNMENENTCNVKPSNDIPANTVINEEINIKKSCQLGTINEDNVQVEFERNKSKEILVTAGCRARPCTATFEVESGEE